MSSLYAASLVGPATIVVVVANVSVPVVDRVCDRFGRNGFGIRWTRSRKRSNASFRTCRNSKLDRVGRSVEERSGKKFSVLSDVSCSTGRSVSPSRSPLFSPLFSSFALATAQSSFSSFYSLLPPGPTVSNRSFSATSSRPPSVRLNRPALSSACESK